MTTTKARLPYIGWQPMELALKDGRELLLSDGYCRVIARWATINGGAHINGWHTDHGHLQMEPTHWLPLPAPPGAPGLQEGVS